MALISIETDFHIALNGFGLLLQGAPNAPAYQVAQAPLYNARFGQGDRSYSDFSFWWFWAQTSFIGYKQEKAWEDDGYFFESEGIDIYRDLGSFSLANSLDYLNGANKTMEYYTYGEAAGTQIIMGRNVTDAKMSARALDGTVIWEDSTTGPNEKIRCSGELGNSKLYIGCQTAGSGTSFLKRLTGGGTITNIGTYTTSAIFCIVPYYTGDGIYFFTATDGLYFVDRATETITQKKTAYPYGLSQLAFSFSLDGPNGAWLVGDRIYFMLFEVSGYASQLWCYDIGDNAYVEVYRFGNGINPQRFIEFNGNLYFFDTNGQNSRLQIWKYTVAADTMERIHEIGRGSSSTALIANLSKNSEAIFFVVDDGTNDYQLWTLDSEDKIAATISPPSQFASTVDMLACTGPGKVIVALEGASGTNKVATNSSSSAYLTTGYLITSNFDGNIPALDKLYNDVTMNFDALASGQAIQILYSIDDGTTFTSLGTASFSVDGAITNKSLPFSGTVVSKKIMLKFVLTGGGTNSPKVHDFSMRYVPVINYTKLWTLRLNASDEVKRLNGRLVTTTARELKGMLEKSWWTKAILDYQDIDYAATQINENPLSSSNTTITVDDTAYFPEQGRLLIENEQILYTGKTPTTFTGCTRGARDTRAVSHADNTVVSNAYKVIITDYGYVVPIINEGKNLEYIVNLTLREV